MSINEKISNFIGNNLEKVSKNNVYQSEPIKAKIAPTSNSIAPEEYIEDSISTFKYIIILLIIILLFAIAWYYIKKYYPQWKNEISQFYDEISKKIYDLFHPQKSNESETKPVEAKNLLTKAQINNFYEKEKEHTEPQPTKPQLNLSFFENKLFDKSDNLNSNKILDYLLNKEKDVKNEEWCFIGESKGERYCTISQGNACMSGNIFPSRDICINPKLRS